MKPVGLSINPVLYKHLILIFNDKKIEKYLSLKGGSIKSHINGFKNSLNIKNEKILIYNTSLLNILVVFILRIKKNKIYFHLHDPIPHSGLLNPIIFFVNQLIVLLSSQVLVFDEKLKNQTIKYYFTKRVKLAKHGYPIFNYRKTFLRNESKITIGMIGRFMPYKGYEKFIRYVANYPEYKYYCIGKGYPKKQFKNLTNIEGFISNNEYYSLVQDLDYIFFGYIDMSFSGVLSDCKYLNKSIIVPKDSFHLMQKSEIDINPNKIFKFSNNLFKNRDLFNLESTGWIEYKKLLKKII